LGAIAEAAGVPARPLGSLAEHKQIVVKLAGQSVMTLGIAELRQAYEEAIPAAMAAYIQGVAEAGD
jgi:hypothetical protein